MLLSHVLQLLEDRKIVKPNQEDGLRKKLSCTSSGLQENCNQHKSIQPSYPILIVSVLRAKTLYLNTISCSILTTFYCVQEMQVNNSYMQNVVEWQSVLLAWTRVLCR